MSLKDEASEVANKVISEHKELEGHGFFYRLSHFPWRDFLHHLGGKSWLPFIPGLVAFLDKFVFVLPTDFVLAGSVVAQKRSWFYSAISTTIGGSIGCALLYLLVAWEPVRNWAMWMMTNISASSVSEISDMVETWGPFATVLVAFSPFPMHIPVFLCAFTGLPFWQVLGWVFVGSLGRYFLIAFGVRQGWSVFQRFAAPAA